MKFSIPWRVFNPWLSGLTICRGLCIPLEQNGLMYILLGQCNLLLKQFWATFKHLVTDLTSSSIHLKLNQVQTTSLQPTSIVSEYIELFHCMMSDGYVFIWYCMYNHVIITICFWYYWDCWATKQCTQSVWEHNVEHIYCYFGATQWSTNLRTI